MKEIVIALLGSGVLSAIISGLFNAAATKRKAKDGVREGVRILLYDRIKHVGKAYISRGDIHTEELEDIIAMHNIYHNELGGNGYLNELMVKVKNLPII